MNLPPLLEPLVMVNHYGRGFSTSDGDGGLFTAEQMTAYATAAVLAERERCAILVETQDTYGDQVKSWFDFLATAIRHSGTADAQLG
jgi:hypothetical protein